MMMDNFCQNGRISPDLLRMARTYPHQLNFIKLSKTQLKVLQSIKSGENVTAWMIAERCDFSQSFTSTLLKRLYDKCFLRRKSVVAYSGGVAYEYFK
ncbi:MarR family transcriptional regulator [Salinivibrio kushneri]|uniref:MarR family transcriptional regulator n=1 Tax=Salinivibrio kushneri TaxID=1908198 RepID=UPI003083CA0F